MPKAPPTPQPSAEAAAKAHPAPPPSASELALPAATDEALREARCERLAAVLVAAGRVVPGLEWDGEGQLCARWWPLPAAEDRPWLEALLPSDDPVAQRQLAERLAAAVDRLVRQRLGQPGPRPRSATSSSARDSAGAGATKLRGHQRGAMALPEAWLAALSGDDPRLPTSRDPVSPDPVPKGAGQALVRRVAAWVRQGVAPGGDWRLSLRCHPPDDGPRRGWGIELLLGPAADPSLLLPLKTFWSGASPFAASAFEGILRQLGLLIRLAPELAPLLQQPAPSELELEEEALVSLVSARAALLSEAGFAVLLPSGLRQNARLGLRARIPNAKGQGSTKAAPAGSGAGLDLAGLFQFEWQAVLGDQPLSAADLEALQQAAELKRPLVRLRGQWTLVDAAAVAGLLKLAGQRGQANGAELLRGGLGLERLGLPPELELAGVEAAGALGTLLAGDLHSRAEALPTPPSFAGELRPYQQRGLGWLVFLGRLGLGACLADDMGLGKTA
ncbi:MAG: SNF2 helicase-associated domain-containing protein, partial [Synechococcaceae cyanobacterium]